MKLIIQILISLNFLNCFCQSKIIPENYTEFRKSPSDGEKMKPLKIDFDNDSKSDYITVIHNKTYDELYSNQKYLLLHLSSHNKNILIDFELFDGTFFIVPKIKNKTLEFSTIQRGSANYSHTIKLRYNKKHKKIELIGYDYSYRASPGNYYSKSYNLLTGKYIVVKYAKKTTTHKGNKKQKNKIFTENLTMKLISNLSSIGSEFEQD